MIKSRGIATITIMALVFTTCVVLTFVAEKYLPKKEAEEVEDVLEKIEQYEIELVLHQSEGPIKKEVDGMLPDNS